MRFTKEQYEQAIKDLQDGMTQLEPNGNGCHICGDSGHQAFECGSNPLYAIACCRHLAEKARELHLQFHKSRQVHDEFAEFFEQLHEFLHYLGGHNTYMGESYGPGKVRPL